jgi:hypothetical protein
MHMHVENSVSSIETGFIYRSFTKSRRRANCQEHKFPPKPTRLGTTRRGIKTCPTALNVVCLPPVPDIIGIRLLASNLDLVDG